PNEGDGEVVLRQVQGDKETKFPAGESRGGGFFPGLGGLGGDIAFSHDSKWLAFTVYPLARESRPPTGETRPATTPRTTPRNKVVLINLANSEKVEFESIRGFRFSGEAAAWIALQKYPAETRTPTATPATGGATPSPFAPPTSPAPTGADLLLHE